MFELAVNVVRRIYKKIVNVKKHVLKASEKDCYSSLFTIDFVKYSKVA